MSIATYNEAMKFIQSAEQISFSESFELIKVCSKLLKDKAAEHHGRDLVIRVIDKKDRIPTNTLPVWNDLIEAAGLYPYLDPKLLSADSLIRYEFHRSPNLKNIFFHQDQFSIAAELLSSQSVVLSAPTSFGKSLLIEEIIASSKYKNIVIIQPTLALLDETRKKLKKYASRYKVIVSTSSLPSEEKGNIYLFTGERVVEYKHFSAVDFFVIDEFYKLSINRDDDRAITLNEALYKLLKYTKNFYLLGPMIKSIPSDFREQFNFKWHYTNFATVAVDEIPVKIKTRAKKEERTHELYQLLLKLEEPTLIYCSSPQKATDLAIGFLEHLVNTETTHQNIKDIIEWLQENIHGSWSLIELLKRKVGFHHGAIPRHLGSSLVDAFNSREIQYLFCTSTLIEGVNTSAKNIVLFDKSKGRKPIDYFDYRNIAGRSGRMNTYFLGTVYNFHNEPAQLELEVDIPIVTQENAPIELLIQIDEKELKQESKKKLEDFNQLDDGLKSVIRLNSGVWIEGQQNLVKELETGINRYWENMHWTQWPSYDQLNTVLNLIWKYLLKPKESKHGVRSANHLTVLTMGYNINKSLSALIRKQISQDYWKDREPNFEQRVNKVTYMILNAARHWFDYKLPKLLGTISSIQKYVFQKNGLQAGDYTFLASQIENGYVAPNFAALMEYDIPLSAIKKITRNLPGSLNAETILARIKRLNLNEVGLINYEKTKIEESIN